MSFNPLIQVQDDNLFIPEVGHWSLDKYRLVGGYCDIFTSAMRKQWRNLVYIDLFAGAGYARIRETGSIYKSSSLIALSTKYEFTNHILCERHEKCVESLIQRVARDHPQKNVQILNIDTNENAGKIIELLPNENTLSFCFVDPFSLDLNFNVIRSLGENRVDFLILLALNMDAVRNLKTYLDADHDRVDRFLGLLNWREKYYENPTAYNRDFIRFLAEQYSNQMVTLGYQDNRQFRQIKSNITNVPLYYLAFYSKHERGNHFFSEVDKYASSQITLGF